REVGLRAAHGLTARDRRGWRPRPGDRRAGRACVPHAAARGAGRAAAGDRVLRSAAASPRRRARAGPGGNRGSGAGADRCPKSDRDREVERPRSAVGRAPGHVGRRTRPAGLRVAPLARELPPGPPAPRRLRSHAASGRRRRDRGRRVRRAWFPKLKAPRPEAKIIQVGQDPLFSRYPIRGFAVDLGLGGAPRLTFAALAEAARRIGVDTTVVAERRARWEAEHRQLRQAWATVGRKAKDDRPVDMLWLSQAIGERLDGTTLV